MSKRNRRSKVKKRSYKSQRFSHISNAKLLAKKYDLQQKKLRRLQNARHIYNPTRQSAKLIDALRRYQNLRAKVFSPPKPRLKRKIRRLIGRQKLFSTRPLKDIICTARKVRKMIMFAKGNVGHGTSNRRRKMSWFSKVRC